MADLKQRIEAECESVEQALAALSKVKSISKLSSLELAGVAALLHNLYNGIENLLKQALLHLGAGLPTGPTWHRDLLDLARERGVVCGEVVELLKPYLAFRHFFSHAYALDLDSERMDPLASGARDAYEKVRDDLQRFVALHGR